MKWQRYEGRWAIGVNDNIMVIREGFPSPLAPRHYGYRVLTLRLDGLRRTYWHVETTIYPGRAETTSDELLVRLLDALPLEEHLPDTEEASPPQKKESS